MVRRLADTGRRVSVNGFHESVAAIDMVPIVTLAVAYDCPRTGQTAILIFHEALEIPDMDLQLLNPFQIRDQGIIVNDKPLHQLNPDEREPTSHSIVSDDPPFQIPLTLRGTMSGFEIRRPTWEEIDDPDALVIHMTSSIPWDPTSDDAEDAEAELRAAFERESTLVHQEPRTFAAVSQPPPCGTSSAWDPPSEGTK